MIISLSSILFSCSLLDFIYSYLHYFFFFLFYFFFFSSSGNEVFQCGLGEDSAPFVEQPTLVTDLVQV